MPLHDQELRDWIHEEIKRVEAEYQVALNNDNQHELPKLRAEIATLNRVYGASRRIYHKLQEAKLASIGQAADTAERIIKNHQVIINGKSK